MARWMSSQVIQSSGEVHVVAGAAASAPEIESELRKIGSPGRGCHRARSIGAMPQPPCQRIKAGEGFVLFAISTSTYEIGNPT